jgi:predicted MFS family arabinose efflux permease
MWQHTDIRAIFAAAFLRSIGVGLAGVILGIYLARRGLTGAQIGIVLGIGLAGAALSTMIAGLRANHLGRRRTLVAIALLAAFGGCGLALTPHFAALLVVAFIGTLNGAGTDRGAAVALEQAILPQCVPDDRRTVTLSWYNLILDAGNALGALAGALPVVAARLVGFNLFRGYQLTFVAFALCNLASAALYLFLSPRVETAAPSGSAARAAAPISPESRRVIARFVGLASLDAFGGGFITDAIVAYWFFLRFGVSEATLGPLFFAGHLLNSGSYLLAARIARRIGLLNTMVFTHVPSSLLLWALPFAPSFPWAVGMILARESLVEMDVPTRQSYLAAVVQPHERVFASGATNVVRNAGWGAGSLLAGYAMQFLALGAPLFIGGSAKIAYDALLYRAFRHLKPPEERSTESENPTVQASSAAAHPVE